MKKYSEARVITIYWKTQARLDIYSNLKNFCSAYPEYNYNTLNNYLSKKKIAYEDNFVKIERKPIFSKFSHVADFTDKMYVVRKKVKINQEDEKEVDHLYWLSQPVQKRAQALTHLIHHYVKPGQKIEKVAVKRIKLK
ncbi:MAG: hypothetical protein EOO99_00380 [Pedobacter sp.]|nr:MAG: hypothetical protein EOO99_00380 [Pedobacter sp.]